MKKHRHRESCATRFRRRVFPEAPVVPASTGDDTTE